MNKNYKINTDIAVFQEKKLKETVDVDKYMTIYIGVSQDKREVAILTSQKW
jgi:hypothetical protein